MRVFLDVDGVLADFVGGIHRAIHKDFDYHQWPYKLGPEGWNFHNELGMSFDSMSALCDFGFWSDLHWTHDGHDILRLVIDRVGLENITLLTTPMPNVMSASGKVEWVRRNLPLLEKNMLICPGGKAKLAKTPDSLLIDDGSCNVEDWRAAGGKAILVPRWWNDNYRRAEDSFFQVLHQLEQLCPRF